MRKGTRMAKTTRKKSPRNTPHAADVRKYRDIDTSTLRKLMSQNPDLLIIDSRDPDEYEKGHIPGSYLYPYSEMEKRAREFVDTSASLVVISETGLRSQAACRFLIKSGFKKVYNVTGGLSSWTGPRKYGKPPDSRLELSPSPFLVENIDILPKGKALDLAMGYGRNTLFLANHGYEVEGIDISTQCVSRVRKIAEASDLKVTATCSDLEKDYVIEKESYDLIICFYYLQRALFPDILDGVKPGGAVVYETFTVDQTRFGRPKNPEHLLKPNELLGVFREWRVLRYREGVVNERKALEGIIALKPSLYEKMD